MRRNYLLRLLIFLVFDYVCHAAAAVPSDAGIVPPEQVKAGTAPNCISIMYKQNQSLIEERTVSHGFERYWAALCGMRVVITNGQNDH